MTRTGGSVLILAVWTLMVLGFLALAVGGYVAANVQAARALRDDATAMALARAGVALAIAELQANPSNYAATVLAEMPDHTGLFRDNAALPGGTFSVTFTMEDTNTASIVTNYGVIRESAKINLDRANATDQARLARAVACLGGRPELASTILSNYPAQKTIAPDMVKRYGSYEALPELLAVDGVDGRLYGGLEGLVTLREFERRYLAGSDTWERRLAYGGVAEGRAVVQEDDGRPSVTAVRRIAFVFDSVTTNLLFWREH